MTAQVEDRLIHQKRQIQESRRGSGSHECPKPKVEDNVKDEGLRKILFRLGPPPGPTRVHQNVHGSAGCCPHVSSLPGSPALPGGVATSLACSATPSAETGGGSPALGRCSRGRKRPLGGSLNHLPPSLPPVWKTGVWLLLSWRIDHHLLFEWSSSRTFRVLVFFFFLPHG